MKKIFCFVNVAKVLIAAIVIALIMICVHTINISHKNYYEGTIISKQTEYINNQPVYSITIITDSGEEFTFLNINRRISDGKRFYASFIQSQLQEGKKYYFITAGKGDNQNIIHHNEY